MTSAWIWAGARAVGTSHCGQGQPCQDAFDCTIWTCGGEPPVLIAALADGAGSAERAEAGARLATSFFVDIVHRAIDDGASMADAAGLLQYAFGETRLALQLKADHDGHAINDFASTLLVAAVSSAGGAFGQIGDGAIVVEDDPCGWRPVHWPDHGEYANTTRFLTESDALEALQITAVNCAPRRFAMFSDGLERLLLDFRNRTAHGPFFDSILGRLTPRMGIGHAADISEDLAHLLTSDKVNSRTDDDKSLFCAAWVGA